MHYPFHIVEPRWQQYWDDNKTFRTGDDRSRPKYYILDMFPYPSGAGLHVGHPEGYTATDIVARYRRMRGFNVLHPMGWDAFGLPAEQYAVKEGKHPAVTTRENIDNFRRQLKRIGFSYDWDREVSTTDPRYYRWTQWIFMQLYRRGLAYVADVPVNWCPELATILANEEVPEQVEKGYTVVRRPMRQWMLRITAYAERLLADLDGLEWPESLKEMQRNWIGRSEGAEVDFRVDGSGEPIRVFTTRPDTLWGATYMVLAPEHPLVASITAPAEAAAVRAYIDAAARKSDMERTELAKEKTGVFTGACAINPVNGGRIPIWIADYVLASYGTGAIMAVPAHDSRDWEFARKFGLPVIEVIAGGNVEEAAFTDTEHGVAVNSGFISGLPCNEAIERVTVWLEQQGLGKRTVNYKLRDWLFSRQRYWGEPFPVIYREDGTHALIPEDQLPLTLPEVENYRPSDTGESPLARADAWLATTDPETGRPARRETNTMPQWAGSCWYYLRFMDPQNDAAFCGAEAERYWQSVDLYVGGAEHAVLHLLYARFWHKVLYDLGYVTTIEPFLRLVNQGLILGEVEYTGFRNADGAWVSAAAVDPDQPSASGVVRVALTKEEVTKTGSTFVLKDHPAIAVHARAYKMSKSRGNVINPDHVIAEHGADSLRLFEMFMGPLEMVKPWSTEGVEGVHRFLDRVWRLFVADAPAGPAGSPDAGGPAAGGPAAGEAPRLDAAVTAAVAPDELLRLLHRTVKKVTEDIEGLRFNTAISQLMIFVNELTKRAERPRAVMEPFVLLLAPFAPHIAEELWRLLGHEATLAREPWPVWDEAYTTDSEVEILLQVNGKLRDKILAPAGTPAPQLEAMARAHERLRGFIEGRTVVKVVTVPDKLVNIVVR